MKTTNRFFTTLIGLLMCFNVSMNAQEDAKPMYITVTTMHWNMDYKDFKMDEWKAVEKEFLDKVVMKNEHILSASFYLHRLTADNTELLYVQSFASWDAIDKASKRSNELSLEAWPKDEDAKIYFDKRNAYYAPEHSDEIYAVMDIAKPLAEAPTKDMVCYVRKGHFNFSGDMGTQAEFDALSKEYADNVTFKNEYIKGYYTYAHAWGAVRTEAIEVFFLDSLADLEKMMDKDGELYEAHWKDEAARKKMEEAGQKYYDNRHGDYVYTFVAGLAK